MPREYFSENDYYSDDERISDARRRDEFRQEQGPDIGTVVAGLAGAAAVLGGIFLIRKKAALSKSFSLNVASLIEGGNKSVREVLIDRGYQKFIIPEPVEGSLFKRLTVGTKNLFTKTLPTPIPTVEEALTVARLQTEKNLSASAKGLGLGKGSLPDMDAFWRHAQETTKSWSRFETLIYGPPVASISPRALLGAANKNITSGAYGSVFLARPNQKSLLNKGLGDIYRIRAKQSGLAAGELRSDISLLRDPALKEGVKIGSIYSSGERIETIRAGFEHIAAKNREEFARMIMPNTSEILHEQQRNILVTQMVKMHKMSSFPLVEKNLKGATAQEIKERLAFKLIGKKDINEMSLKELMMSHDYLASKSPINISSARQILKLNADLAKSRAKESGEILYRQVLNAKSTGMRYWLYKLQTRLGIGQMYARKGAGVIPGTARDLFTKAGAFSAVDPITKGRYPAFISHYELGLRQFSKGVPGREHIIKKASIGGMAGGERGQWFVYHGKGSFKRFAIKNFLEGTFIGAFEETTGLGVRRGGRGSIGKIITNKLGIGSGGYAEYGINMFTGVAKLAAITAGLVYTYNTINSLAREATGGWGPTDIAAKGYTAAREFQQQILSDIGVVGAAKELDRSYPGTVKSPLAYLIRGSAPIWMQRAGEAIGRNISQPQLLSSRNRFLNRLGLNLATKGVKNLRQFGSRVGLAMGTAMALLLWGDITQTPEELHQIYSGEKEIPVRKGRWWMFGQCLHPKTLISIGYGCLLKPADEVITGDTVTNYLGDKTEVVKVVSRAMKEHEIMFDIRTASNRSAGAMVTDNHPLYCVKPHVCPTSSYSYCRPDRNAKNTCHKNTCWKDFKPEWVQAINVNVGDYLVFPIPNEGQLETLNGIIIDEDLAFIIGHYIAKGNILQTKNNKADAIELSCSSNEAIMQHDLYASQDGVSSVSIIGNSKNGKKIRVFGVNFTDKIYNLCGTGKNKIIPSEAVGLKRNLLISLLRGYFYGDGGFSNNQPSITSSRMDFLVFVQRAMLILGYTSSIVPYDGVAFGKHYYSYRIILQRSSAFLFKKEGADQIQEYSNVKNVYQFIHDGNLYAKVISKVDTGYNGMVLDFQVKSGESFCGLSFILHNTSFFGGKIQYYRPHWYPLMKSRYKYRGQLWDNESEEIMHSGLIGGALSVITLGAWDPYRWEKKHYFDRPYPITAPLVDPMLPFAGLINMTIGNVIKPRKMMHPAYFGRPQPGSENLGYRQVSGASGAMGMQEYSPAGELPAISPGSLRWQLSEELYTHAERLGLRGYILNAMLFEKLTGRPDFTPEGPVLESAGKAIGWERNYWDRELGDPFFLTEFLRRVLPHRRRQIDEYNPIRNQMPDWLPGEDYFIDFKRGDPYVKIPMGEARLPGAGYESLHPLHSGVPGVYDAVDRFMVLSDVAPYSDEYLQYRALAIAATKKDDYWKGKVRTKISQRSSINKEYDFLELEAPEGALPFSGAYRQLLNMATRTPNPLEVLPFSPFTVNKWVPYKTAQTMYEDYMLYGDMFQPWSDFPGAFMKPFFNKVIGRSMNLVGATYIPMGEQNRREYEDYFDRLKYLKYSTLANMSQDAGQKTFHAKMSTKARQTMVGVNAYGSWKDVFYAIPKRERAFYEEFALAEPGQQDKISSLVSPQMRRIYEARWGVSGRGQESQEDMEEYFENHYLPPSEWRGWNPDVDLGDVQLRTVKNEGMDIHAFNLWQSHERELARKPYVPVIEDIHQHTKNYSMIQRAMERSLVDREFGNARVNIVSSPSYRNNVRIKVNMRKRSQFNAADMLATFAGI